MTVNYFAGGSLPVGGQVGQLLGKVSNHDYDVDWFLPPVASSQTGDSVLDWVNVKNYGVKGDLQIVSDAYCTDENSGAVSSSSANFTQADVGKTCWGIDAISGNGVNFLPCYQNYAGTIVKVVDAHNILVSAMCGKGHACYFYWGTDDTVALKAAWAAAKASSKVCYVPAGNYLFSSLVFDNTNGADVSLIGAGGLTSNTVFYPSPLFDFTNSVPNRGMLITNSGSYRNRIGGFRVDCSSFIWPQPQDAYFVDTSNAGHVFDVFIINAQWSTNGHLCGIGAPEGHDGIWERIRVEGLGQMNGIFINTSEEGCLIDCFTTNGGKFQIGNVNNGTAYQNEGNYLSLFGCKVDEGSEMVIGNSSSVTLVGCSLMAGFNPAVAPITIDGKSDVSMFGCQVGPYSYRNNAGGPVIKAGGILRASGCRFFHTGTGTGLDNDGTFYDCGGNKISSIGGSGNWVSLTTNSLPPALS